MQLRNHPYGIALACVGLVLALVLAYGAGQRSVRSQLSVAPADTLQRLSLKSRERPSAYHLIPDMDVLSQADREAVWRVGGEISFAALYGDDQTVRLILRGVYFRDEDAAAKYASVHEEQQRPIRGFRRPTPEGA